MSTEVIQFAVENGMARVTLNRPEKMNALNPEMIVRLARCWDAIGADPSVRVRRPHEAGLQRALVNIVCEAAVAPEQAVVLNALDPLSEPASGHSLESSAARWTARRIDA